MFITLIYKNCLQLKHITSNFYQNLLTKQDVLFSNLISKYTMQNNEAYIFDEIWGELSRAKVDSKHSFRYPVLSTVSADNWPEARILVLRDAIKSTSRLIFYTDSRSPKVEQIRKNRHAILVFYNNKKKVQLRIKGLVNTLQSSQKHQNYFNNIVQTELKDYRSTQPPGTVKTSEEISYLSKEVAKDNFCVIEFEAIDIDYLQLSRDEHKRINFKYEKDRWVSEEIVP